MAIVNEIIDTQLIVYRRVDDGPGIGLRSRYATDPHPNTEKDIDGWHWDQRKWSADDYLNQAQVAPTLWDPSTIGIGDLLRNGVGDNNDLLVEGIHAQEFNSLTYWRPRILHGFYYAENNEFYLHSDDGITEFVEANTLVDSGGNRLQLSYNPKPGVPIIAAGYEWNRSEGFYEVDRYVRKRVQFTGQYTTSGELITQSNNTIFWENVNLAFDEWQLDNSTSPPTAQFNQQVVNLVGPSVPVTISGLSTAELEEMDNLGVATGQNNEQFRLKYSPVDRTSDIGIYSSYLGADFRKYTIVDEFTPAGSDECMVDYDLGVVTFGSATDGGLPPFGSTIRAAYYKTVGIEYEPEDSRNYVEHAEADLNPVRRFSADGFVHLRRKPQDISRLELSALLPELGEDFFGPLFVGNSFANVQCTAYSQDDELIEGASITFEILSVGGGSFGTSATATAITNGEGVATTLFNPPRTIEQLGGVTDEVTTSGVGSELFLEGYTPAVQDSPLFLFQVAKTDHILGVPKNELKDYYEEFLLTEADMTTATLGGTGPGPAIDHALDPDGNFAWLGSAYDRWIKWEVWHREVHGLPTPIVYEYDEIGSQFNDLRTGKKTVVAKIDPTAVNPHTGTIPAIVPVQPATFVPTDSGSRILFDEMLDPVTLTSAHRSYLIVGPSRVTLRARAFNARTNTTVLSNTIDILVDVPDSAKGLFQIDTINAVPSGMLTNAHYQNQQPVELESVELTTSGLLPLGWRLRSPGITLASALDGVTFLDLNPLPQSYRDEREDSDSEMRINTTHQLEVDI